MPAIVDKKLFERVAQMRAKKKKSPTSARNEAEYLLTTKLFCGYHGRDPESRVMMVGVSGTSKNGKKYNYYTCKSVWKKQGCKKKPVQKEHIENFIFEKAREQLTAENIEYISKIIIEISKEENNAPMIAELKKKVKDNAAAIENLMLAIERGGDNIDLISERITQKRKEKIELEKILEREQWNDTEVSEGDTI
jgi:hypothetical protein